MPLRTREARAERLVFEETLKARLVRLEAHYARLDEGLTRIESELALDRSVDGSLEAMPIEPTAATEETRAKRSDRQGRRPRKPR